MPIPIQKSVDWPATGKTTFQVPVGAATVFFKNEGTKFSEISDGTARTILLVEVDPSQAVIWTKPDDWEVDMQNVLARHRAD